MNKIVYIVFGVSGSGKTTIGQSLAKELGLPFYDADEFHSEANVKKMSEGIPLTDQDRKPWLESISEEIKNWNQNNGAVLACSALKKKYRKILRSIDQEYLNWIFLEGSYELIAERLTLRKDHFFDSGLLSSQFEALERPDDGIIISIDQPVHSIVTKIKTALNTHKAEVGLIGLGVMGKSIAKNLLSKNFSLSVYNRQINGKEEDVANRFVAEQSGTPLVMGFDALAPFVNSLQQPRTILLMVNAGAAVDQMIDALIPMISPGDCIIDGGNSHYKNANKRVEKLKKIGVHFIGAGISGGEEGALKGPSIMPGGSKEAYNISGKFLEAIAGKDTKGNPCCNYIGVEGSGHFVKMVHNGIEYAEMQLLAEIYHLLRFYCKKTPDQISEILDCWRKNGKDGFLIEITTNILQKKEGNGYLIDKILDKAGQKGTGGWSTVSALDLGIPLSTISEAVMARNLSGMKSKRVEASKVYNFPQEILPLDTAEFIKQLEKAYYTASIINHSIGFDLISEASETFNWNLNVSEIARIWTNGCIIRSELMERIMEMFAAHKNIPLLLIPEMVTTVASSLADLQNTVATAIKLGCAIPVLSAAVNYMLTYTSEQSSANMIQAQRDYFGAHTYLRTDQPITEYFHTNWKSE